MPCIEHIKRHMHVINLSSEKDFRALNKAKQQPEKAASFDLIVRNAQPLEISVAGRKVVIPFGEIGFACQFSFSQLFSDAHSAADYLAICKNFPQIFIISVPLLDYSMRNEVRRLIIFIDICYESRVSQNLAKRSSFP